MRIKLNLFLAVLMAVGVIFINGCGENGEKKASEEKNTARVLGEIWEGLRANNQEPYNALKDKTFELTLAIISPDTQFHTKKTNSGGKIKNPAFTVLESVSLAGPQKILLMLTPEEMAAIKYDKGVPVVWGKVRATVGPSLDEDSLVFGLAQEPSSINLIKDEAKDEIWSTIPLEVWEKRMRDQLTIIKVAFSNYVFFKQEQPDNLDALPEYRASKDPAIRVEFVPSKKSNGESSFIAVAFSPDGKYKMAIDYSMDSATQMKMVPVE